MVTVCHGPLGRRQSSSLSSFRTTLVESYQDNFLVCCLCSPIRVYLSSPSALLCPPTPTSLDPSQLKGLMASEGISQGIKKLLPEWINFIAAMLMLSTFDLQSILAIAVAGEEATIVYKFPACLEVFTHIRAGWNNKSVVDKEMAAAQTLYCHHVVRGVISLVPSRPQCNFTAASNRPLLSSAI